MKPFVLAAVVFSTMAQAALLQAQAPPPPPPANPRFAEQLGYVISQAGTGFQELRADSIGAGSWRSRYRLSVSLDSATALSASSISELARQHADGRPGKAVVAVFPLALVGPGADSTAFTGFQGTITAALPAWHKRGPGNWSECSDPKRGREILLFPTRTASGEALLALSITVHPDPACA